jgi:hypothetical protein
MTDEYVAGEDPELVAEVIAELEEEREALGRAP